MLALVTGVAGFIGSTLAEQLVADGWLVRGVDRFTAYYEESAKRANLVTVSKSPSFELVEADLRFCDLEHLLQGVDVVFHLAGQPGVRLSWADGFATYNDLNVNVTQRLLEASRGRPLQRFVFASSSSVYGDAATVPCREDDPKSPHSPYGVTKFAAELLCSAYGSNFEIPTTSLRYFTVYGPRQRPDMAVHRLIEAGLGSRPFGLFGDGLQVRDFTYVDDIVDATIRAASADVAPGMVINAAGGSSVTMAHLVGLVGALLGQPINIDHQPAQPGDVRATGGFTERAQQLLNWAPRVSLETGLERQVEWHRSRLATR